jgi:hypothetical protein
LVRSVPTQNRRPPPKAMKCLVPPVISILSCSSECSGVLLQNQHSKTEHLTSVCMQLA